MIHSIAVTTDFSEASRVAFGPGRALATKFQADLYLVHLAQSPQIYTPWQIPGESSADADRLRELDRRLKEFAGAEPAFRGIAVKPRVLSGDLPEAIEEFRMQELVDLFVIATHGRSDAKLFPLGSFAAKILRFVSCPVLVFRDLGREQAAACRSFNPRRILVPHDFSRSSARSIELARAWARAYESSVKLVTVVEPFLTLYGDSILTAQDLTDHDRRAQDEVKGRLQRLARGEWAGLETRTSVRVGHPAVEILKEIAADRPDLVIMGSRGLSIQDRGTLGSVAERTIQGAPCPVLVVKSRD